MSDRLAMGLVGCGLAAIREIIPPLLSERGRDAVDLVAVCDLDAARAEETARRFNIPAHFTDHRKMLANTDLDIVAVTTPIGSHYTIARDAIEAGKHTYIQKTMTVTVDEATALIDAAASSRVRVAASPATFLAPTGPYPKPFVDAVIRWIDSGALGTLAWGRVSTHLRHEDELGDDGLSREVDPSWYYRPSGGPLRDLAVYSLHPLTWILGRALSVTAVSGILLPERTWRGQTIRVETDDCISSIVEFVGGVQVAVNASFIKGNPSAPKLELVGSKGVITVGGRGALGAAELWVQMKTGSTYGLDHEVREVLPFDEREYQPGEHILADILDLAESVREDRAPRASAEHARHVIEIIEKTYVAANSGERQLLTTSFDRPGRK